MNPPKGIKQVKLGKMAPGFGRALKETKLQLAPKMGQHLGATNLTIGLKKLGKGKDAFVSVSPNSTRLTEFKKKMQAQPAVTWRFADGTEMEVIDSSPKEIVRASEKDDTFALDTTSMPKKREPRDVTVSSISDMLGRMDHHYELALKYLDQSRRLEDGEKVGLLQARSQQILFSVGMAFVYQIADVMDVMGRIQGEMDPEMISKLRGDIIEKKHKLRWMLGRVSQELAPEKLASQGQVKPAEEAVRPHIISLVDRLGSTSDWSSELYEGGVFDKLVRLHKYHLNDAEIAFFLEKNPDFYWQLESGLDKGHFDEVVMFKLEVAVVQTRSEGPDNPSRSLGVVREVGRFIEMVERILPGYEHGLEIGYFESQAAALNKADSQ